MRQVDQLFILFILRVQNLTAAQPQQVADTHVLISVVADNIKCLGVHPAVNKDLHQSHFVHAGERLVIQLCQVTVKHVLSGMRHIIIEQTAAHLLAVFLRKDLIFRSTAEGIEASDSHFHLALLAQMQQKTWVIHIQGGALLHIFTDIH